MSEFRKHFGFQRQRQPHPEAQGQELEMIPVTQNTLKTLVSTAEAIMGDSRIGDIRFGTGETPVYTVVLIPRSGRKSLGGRILTIHDSSSPSATYELGKPRFFTHLRIRKDVGIEEQLFPQGANSPVTPDLLERAVDLYDASQRGQREMSEITRLPMVTEGEIRRMIDIINAETFTPISLTEYHSRGYR